MTKEITIYGVKTPSCLFISNTSALSQWNDDQLKNLYFDSVKAEPSFKKNWFKIPDTPKKVHRMISQPSINHRYELIDPSMESDKIPARLEKDLVEDPDEDFGWIGSYSHLSSLYKLVSDKQDPIEEGVPFKLEILATMESIPGSTDFSYTVQKTQYSSDGTTQLKEDKIKHNLIDTLMFPEISLCEKLCKLSSWDSYRIVREHIKNNINKSCARITSDYDFCFTVEKIIGLNDAYEHRTEILNRRGGSYKKPRYSTKTISTRSVKVFSMTSQEKAYKGYPILPGFQGINHEDLKKNINTYLEDLMTKINTPLCDCQHCNGTGVVTDN